MQEEKSLAYTLILGVCILLSLLMVGRMLLGRSAAELPTRQETQEETEMEVTLTESDLATLIGKALPLTPESMTVKISRNGTVSVSASVTRRALTESGLLSGGMRTALLFLPDPCRVYGAWKLSMGETGLCLSTQQAQVAGFSVPPAAAQKLAQTITEETVRQLAAWGVTARSAECHDGSVVFRA